MLLILPPLPLLMALSMRRRMPRLSHRKPVSRRKPCEPYQGRSTAGQHTTASPTTAARLAVERAPIRPITPTSPPPVTIPRLTASVSTAVALPFVLPDRPVFTSCMFTTPARDVRRTSSTYRRAPIGLFVERRSIHAGSESR